MGPIPGEFVADDDGALLVGRWRATALAQELGPAPLFAYDRAIIADRVSRFRRAMPSEIALHYAVKANPFPPLLKFIAPLVDGFDIASVGELDHLAGCDASETSFAGPGKSDDELEIAVAAGITLNVESENEAVRAIELGRAMDVQPRLAVRVNPPFGLKGAGMKMGGTASPFGIDHDRVPALVRRIVEAGANWRGLHIYAGSQTLHAEAIIEVQRETVLLAGAIAEQSGYAPPHVNLGGGFGIPYFASDRPLDLDAVGGALRKTLSERPKILADTMFAIELGRWLVGEAGVYLVRVVDVKNSGGKRFVITDGGLQHMLAATGNFGQLLRRNYPIANATRFGDSATAEVTVTGCLCTPLDLLGDEVMLPRTEVGDLIAIFCAGAYGLTASPVGFLSQPSAKEVLV